MSRRVHVQGQMEKHQRFPEKVLSPGDALRALIGQLETDPGDYEPISPDLWPPLQMLLPPNGVRARTLFLTKQSVLARLLAEDLLPRDSVVLCRYGLPSKEYLRTVREQLSKARPAIFLGDLDPLDLHVYLALSYNAIIPSGRPSVGIHYGGLNDSCLRLCERDLRDGQRLDAAIIKMHAAEVRHFATLDRMVDVAAIVGKRSRDLLRSGWKLELEGATNAVYFRDGHLAALLRAVIGAGRRKPPTLPRLASR